MDGRQADNQCHRPWRDLEKEGPGSALFWVNSVKDGKPVSGASVTLWSWANQPVAEGKTDRDGIASLNISGENDEGVLATVKKGDDIAFIRNGKRTLLRTQRI